MKVIRTLRVPALALLVFAALMGCASPDGRSRAVDSGHEGVLERIARARAARGPSSAMPSEEIDDLDGPQPRHSHFPSFGSTSEVSGVIPKRMPRIALAWPVRVPRVTSGFGLRGQEFHEGIDLRASSGTAIYAAHAGVVIYADRKIRGYGQMVVLKHSSGLATVYAHNSKILVRTGQQIEQGQQIAVSGRSGHVSGPHLHFEVRRGIAALDPMKFLPAGGSGASMVRTSGKRHAAVLGGHVGAIEIPEPLVSAAPRAKLTASHD